ncbi:hypothetical protein FACS1894187_16830 [Synergistales bacterium]|nr:hypothetical protein FACS1894187_16830 [Synergistales bacterium]
MRNGRPKPTPLRDAPLTDDRFYARALGGLALALLIAFALFRRGGGASENGAIRVVAPDNTGGLPIRWMLRDAAETFHATSFLPDEIIPTADCCSATAQWTMSSGRVDIAVMCPDAAESLLEKDPRYALLGAVAVNSDILVTRRENGSDKVGVMQSRRYQADALSSRFDYADIVTLFPAGIAYALERKFLGGGVMDALSAWMLSGDKEPLSVGDVDTYVLVVSKTFADSSEFGGFAARFNKSVEELSTPDGLQNAVLFYKGLRWNQEDVEQWKRLRIKFRKISL